MTTPYEHQDLKKVQANVLAIYKDIIKICDKYNIRYYALAGTAIGSIRHSGFIPWDDDIDLAMPRTDYEKFIKHSKELPPHLQFTDYSIVANSPIVFGKVLAINTCYTNANDINNPDTYYGIFVDIMPMDGVPANTLLYWLHRQYLKRILQIHNAVINSQSNSNNGGITKNFILKIIRLLNAIGILNKQRLKSKFKNIVRKYDFDTSTFTACMWQFDSSTGIDVYSRYRTQDFQTYIDMNFEDTTMRMPIGYENYFKAVCPDYMTPPPKEKQLPHHSGIIDFERSYKLYVNDIKDKICK